MLKNPNLCAITLNWRRFVVYLQKKKMYNNIVNEDGLAMPLSIRKNGAEYVFSVVPLRRGSSTFWWCGYKDTYDTRILFREFGETFGEAFAHAHDMMHRLGVLDNAEGEYTDAEH